MARRKFTKREKAFLGSTISKAQVKRDIADVKLQSSLFKKKKKRSRFSLRRK